MMKPVEMCKKHLQIVSKSSIIDLLYCNVLKGSFMALDLFNYGKAGKGVSKDGPRKKSFFLFWEIFGAKFWKFFQINLIYILFCLPIVTFGPATAAMTQVMRKFVIGEPIFIFHEFKTAFKKNFKQAFFVGIFDLGIIALAVFNLNYYAAVFSDSSADMTNKILAALSVAILFIVYMAHFYIYPQIVALTLKVPQIIKNSLILMVVGMKRSFVALFSNLAIIVLMVFGFPYSVLVLPLLPMAWMCFIATFCAYPVIQKHIIDPYYLARGERNPEYARYETSGEDAIFEDKGGSEEPVDLNAGKSGAKRKKGEKVTVKAKGKVIK